MLQQGDWESDQLSKASCEARAAGPGGGGDADDVVAGNLRAGTAVGGFLVVGGLAEDVAAGVWGWSQLSRLLGT